MRPEGTLIREACSGDGTAFDELVAPYMDKAYRLAFLIARDRDAAADAVQEALLRAYRSLRNLRPDHPFLPWFTRIVVNEAIKQGRRGRSFLRLLEARFRPAPSRTGLPEEALQLREEQLQVWEAVQQLPPAHRAVIVLRYYEELSEAEMARVLDLRPGTVKSQLYRARAALERVLGERSGEAPAEIKPVPQGGVGHD
ncbi:MAG: RNA polymerase sigma factor [Bacillota bacterium]